MLVGVADTVDDLLSDHESIGRAVIQVRMPRMSKAEIGEILTSGTATLGMEIDPAACARIVEMTQGLPHYAHLLGLHAVRQALRMATLRVIPFHVDSAVASAVRDTSQTVRRAYLNAIASSRKDSLFPAVLLACALAECDEMGCFSPQDVRVPLSRILNRPIDIAGFTQHLHEFSELKRLRILQKVGEARRYRFRFADALMRPYVIMRGAEERRLPTDWFTQYEDES